MNKRVIGIAGYSGSGKSTLSEIISKRKNYFLINVDSLAKEIMENSSSIIIKLKESFGEDICVSGKIDFSALGTIAFSDRKSLLTLNSIVHPSLLKELKNQIDKQSQGGVVVDAALISYWEIESWFDSLYWVKLSREERLGRIIRRVKNLSLEELNKRFEIQETLFEEPSGIWKIIDNSSDIEGFYNRFLDLEEN